MLKKKCILKVYFLAGIKIQMHLLSVLSKIDYPIADTQILHFHSSNCPNQWKQEQLRRFIDAMNEKQNKEVVPC